MMQGALVADFSSFVQACAKAEVSLKGFEGSAGKVETSLNKMANSLAGTRLIQDAQLMTAAVTKTGGAAKLTDAEMARVNATVTEAIQKFERLGQTAPQDMRDLADATKKVHVATESATKMTASWKDQLSGLAGTLGIAFSVGAVVSFGKELLRMGDEIVRVADRTGLTTDEVQRLSYVAQQSGNSIEELTGAIGQMQNRLSSGDKSAVQAVKELHLNFAALAAASPAKQLEMIATEIAKIPDPAARTSIAMDLFGKTGTAILPTLTAQFAALAGTAPVMSEATVRALDTAGDQLGRFGLQIKVWAAESYNFLRQGFDAVIAFAFKTIAVLYDVGAGIDAALLKIPGAAKVFPSLTTNLAESRTQAQFFRDAAAGMAAQTDGATTAAKKFTPVVRATAESLAEAASAAKKAATEFKATTAEVHKLEGGLFLIPDSLHQIGRAFDESKVDDFTKKVGEIEQNAHIANFGFKGMTDGLKDVGEAAGHTVDELNNFSKFDFVGPIQGIDKTTHSVDALAQHFAQLGQIAGGSLDGMTRAAGLFIASVHQMSQSTGNLKADFKDLKKDWDDLSKSQKEAAIVMAGLSIAAAATDPKSKTGQTLSYASKGAQIGSIAGPYGALIGAGVGAIVGALKVSQNEKEARATFAAFQDQFGTLNQTITAVGKAYAAMGLSGVRAEHDLRTALEATHHSAKDVEAALATINAVLNEQKQDAADLDTAIQKYGFSIEELGPAMQRQKLTEQAVQLMNDFRLLTGAGIDMNLVLERMGGSINEFVKSSLRTGQEIPSSMKPVLEKMIELGTLTDENGVAITDLGESGLTFSETLTQGFDRVVKKFDELLAKIGLVPAALNTIPTERTVHIGYQYDAYTPPDQGNYAAMGGLVTAHGIQYRAGGGNILPFRPRGTDTVPAMLTPGERVLSVRETNAYNAGAAAGGGNVVSLSEVTAELRALRTDNARRDASFTKTLARAVRDEVQKVARH